MTLVSLPDYSRCLGLVLSKNKHHTGLLLAWEPAWGLSSGEHHIQIRAFPHLPLPLPALPPAAPLPLSGPLPPPSVLQGWLSLCSLPLLLPLLLPLIPSPLPPLSLAFSLALSLPFSKQRVPHRRREQCLDTSGGGAGGDVARTLWWSGLPLSWAIRLQGAPKQVRPPGGAQGQAGLQVGNQHLAPHLNRKCDDPSSGLGF